MACRGLFVTGTNTDVGKTYVSRLILEQLEQQGDAPGAYKPVCSGAMLSAQGTPFWHDAEQLAQAIRTRFSPEQIAPQRFQAAVAPPRAAQLEGREVQEEFLLQHLCWWESQTEWLLVEGAGGLLSPVSRNFLVADLACECGYPLLIVAHLGLGTINHTLLTVAAARQRGLSIAGIVLNETSQEQSDLSARYNYEDLANLTDVPILGMIPYQGQYLQNVFRQEIPGKWREVFDFSSRVR